MLLLSTLYGSRNIRRDVLNDVALDGGLTRRPKLFRKTPTTTLTLDFLDKRRQTLKLKFFVNKFYYIN